MSIKENKVQEVDAKEVPKANTDSRNDSEVYIPNEGEELVSYRFADTVISCGVCGKDTSIKHPLWTNVEAGIQLPYLQTDNHSLMGIACEHCNAKLTLRFVEAKTPPAYDFSHKGFENPTELGLSWTGGKDVKQYKVYTKLNSTEDVEGDDTDSFTLLTSTKDSFCSLSIPENDAILVRVDSIYDELEEVVIGSEVAFISTEKYPEDTNTGDTPKVELDKVN